MNRDAEYLKDKIEEDNKLFRRVVLAVVALAAVILIATAGQTIQGW